MNDATIHKTRVGAPRDLRVQIVYVLYEEFTKRRAVVKCVLLQGDIQGVECRTDFNDTASNLLGHLRLDVDNFLVCFRTCCDGLIPDQDIDRHFTSDDDRHIDCLGIGCHDSIGCQTKITSRSDLDCAIGIQNSGSEDI